MIDVDFNADNLWGFTQAMSPRDRVRLMKGAMRDAANDIKHRAADIMMSRLKEVRNRAALKRTIWTKIYDRSSGFRVTVAGNSHGYPSRMVNKQGGVRDLPLGRWLEAGTGERSTSKGYARGMLPAIGFLGQAVEELEESTSERLGDHFIERVKKEASKYGCI